MQRTRNVYKNENYSLNGLIIIGLQLAIAT